MSSGMQSVESLRLVGLQDLKKNSGWYLFLGLLLIVLGTIAIFRTFFFTVVSVIFFGWLLLIGGVIEIIHAFWKHRGWSGFFLELLAGILYTVVGFMIVANPGASAVALTLLIAMFLIFGGLFRIIASIAVRPPHWGWVTLHGVISLLLGVLIWQEWPLSGIWVIGLFVGIEMLFNGWALVMLSAAVKNLPAASTAA